jgi:hypothetical protein
MGGKDLDEQRAPDDYQESARRQHERLRYFTFWSVLAAASIFAGIFLAFNIYLLWSDESIRNLIKDHYAATIGLPMAALASLVLVIVLEAGAGPIQFKAAGFEFKGASGQVVLWVFVFLAISGAIKLLW